MRIGIEAQRLFRPHKHGMDRVVLELIKNLQKIDTQNQYFIFVKPDEDRNVIQSTKNFNIVEIPGRLYPLWEQVELPKFVKEYKCDLLHCTSSTAPLKVESKLITTLHDIIFKEEGILKQLISSASWYQKIGNLYRRFLVNDVVKKSSRLITVSNFEKENIMNTFQLDDQKITTVHNGVHKGFKNYFDKYQKEEIRNKYKLSEQYLFHIGNKEPRKNTKRVLDAFYELKLTEFKDMILVIIGINEATLNSMLDEMCIPYLLKKDILITSYVSDEDLPIIYNLSSLFLFPSLREGFGIPIIEAMASGVPVISSNTSSMPEVSGGCAHLIDPTSTEELAKAIIHILSDQEYRERLICRGLEQSKAFSWAQSAKNVLEIYEQFDS